MYVCVYIHIYAYIFYICLCTYLEGGKGKMKMYTLFVYIYAISSTNNQEWSIWENLRCQEIKDSSLYNLLYCSNFLLHIYSLFTLNKRIYIWIC